MVLKLKILIRALRPWEWDKGNVTLRKYSANSSDQQIRQQRRKYVRPGKIIKVSLGALRIRYAIIANDPIIRLRKEPTIEARKLNRK